MDWDLGFYEHFAVQIQAVAETVVDAVAPTPDEVVLDVGCGTGNAALILAARGARVTGVDPSPRLLAVARTAAATAGLTARFEPGDAANLPVPDNSADAIVSVFGAIFAPDAAAAATEFMRVLKPGGRIVLSAWLREGARVAQTNLRNKLVAGVQPEASGTALFAWHDVPALTSLFAPYGVEVSVREHAIEFRDTSPEAYTDADLANHPLWVEARPLLKQAGRWDSVRDQLLELFTTANEDPDAFQVTSRYIVATATKPM